MQSHGWRRRWRCSKKQEAICLELGNKGGLGRCYWQWGLLAQQQGDRQAKRVDAPVVSGLAFNSRPQARNFSLQKEDRIALGSLTPYSTGSSWDAWIVPTFGGQPKRWLPNASGLVWIAPQRIMFSEIKSGEHMAIVSSLESRAEPRHVYVPPHDRGMAHRSYLSPDGKSVLLAEMDNGQWLPCRLVPFGGESAGKSVGPPSAPCTDGAWSPDGRWIYLSMRTGDHFHIWRQHFPDGQPEQITSGPTEHEGIAVCAGRPFSHYFGGSPFQNHFCS